VTHIGPVSGQQPHNRQNPLMIQLKQTVLLAAAIIALAAAATAAPQYRTYSNPRFGTHAEVPANWTENPPPENGDGQSFSSPDQHATIIVAGSLNIDDTVEEAMKAYEKPHEGETVTYRHRGARTLVVSGTRGDTIFYNKHFLSCGDQIWNNLYIEYPAAEKEAYDAIVTRVAKSLGSGRSGWVPRCK
jgi:hypothetical protein